MTSSRICGNFKFQTEENYAEFLEAMGANKEMVDRVMSSLPNEELVLKNNENGTWTMGKKERTSTFKLNEDWDENWGQVTAKNNVEVSGDKMIRNTIVESIGKKMLMIIEPYQNGGGIEVTQTCGNVTAKRIFTRI